jgi:hypothetical protein
VGDEHWNATSTSGIPPSRWCSSSVSRPPLKACLLILFYSLCQQCAIQWVLYNGTGVRGGNTLIWFGVSVMKIAELANV